jgi:uncharacterized glyoxalase superfamily protein PhnB
MPQIPDTHQTVMPYLILENASRFRKFLQNVFNAKETFVKMRDEHAIMHAEVMIGNSTIMFADSSDSWQSQTAGLFIYVNDADEYYHRALAEGSSSIMPPSTQAYGRSCGITDPFGNVWWITSIIRQKAATT